MTKITKLDKAALIALRPKIDEALAKLGEELGLEFHAGSGSYGEGAEAHFKLAIKVDDPAAQEAAARAEFNRYCGLFDLVPDDFGREFGSGAKRYRLVGLAMNRSKYPLRVMDISAGKVVLLQEMAKHAIIAARPKAPAAAATLEISAPPARQAQG